MFTSALRNSDGELSNDTLCDCGNGSAIKGTGTGVAGTDGAVFFVALFGVLGIGTDFDVCDDCTEVSCSEFAEVVAEELVTGGVEEAFEITIVEVFNAVALSEKIAMRMPTTSAATIPR